VLVFVEVKLRSESSLVPGYFAVSAKKKDILRKTCKAYLRNFTTAGVPHRFDIVEVKIRDSGNLPEILHYENVKLF
jgi:Holliday junction resolvase-like predicted endonuclease